MEFRKRIMSAGKRKTVILNWEDIMDGNIRISSDLAKTGTPRLVPINDTLQCWLDWIMEKETLVGPIVGSKFRKRWSEWKKEYAPLLPWEKQDVLRHSYGTYRVSQAQEIGKVALEM